MRLAFDTRQIVQELKSSGFSDAQADVLVTREVLRNELGEQKADILKWVVGAIAFQTLAILGGALALLRLAAG